MKGSYTYQVQVVHTFIVVVTLMSGYASACGIVIESCTGEHRLMEQ